MNAFRRIPAHGLPRTSVATPRVAGIPIEHLWSPSLGFFSRTQPKFFFCRDLSSNQLSLISRKTFSGCPSLRNLQLESNHIACVDEAALRQLKNLEVITLSRNNLTRISRYVRPDGGTERSTALTSQRRHRRHPPRRPARVIALRLTKISGIRSFRNCRAPAPAPALPRLARVLVFP